MAQLDSFSGDYNLSYPDYQADKATFAKFLSEHVIKTFLPDNIDENEDPNMIVEPNDEDHNIVQQACYPPLLQRIKDRNFFENSNTFDVEIPLSELVDWDQINGGDLAERASKNTLRYREIFCKAIDEALENLEPSEAHAVPEVRDVVDILYEQRMAVEREAGQQVAGAAGDDDVNNPYNDGGIRNDAAQVNLVNNAGEATDGFPAILMRRYEVRILPLNRRGSSPPFVNQYIKTSSKDEETAIPGLSLREIRSQSLGKLVTVQGMIVRASDVKPLCAVATYACDACGCEVYQVVQNKREFLPERVCRSPECQQRRGGQSDTLHLQTRGSKFVKFQELKLQELPNQVPMGHIPRSLSIHCRGELCRLATPGDIVTIDGIFLPQRIAESGFRAMKAGLVSTTFMEAQNILIHKKSYEISLLNSLSEDESLKIDGQLRKVAESDDPIGILSASIAPEIFGHEDIKRSLLLQLVGGCTRQLPDGMRIRGDINICLMGDPGVAKSQLLKHVASIAPRGVYTTGKGSSGVGLTAAVTKDLTTGEMALEGGALVLADRGICCIDEFDKMDESDRTAIHEVMEQQTVSIAKAGIVATLNARAAVLAAANPLYSRYNRKKSLSENVNLPNSLLSRFDLLFLVLDIADMDRDMALARHVTMVHQNEGVGEKANEPEESVERESEEDDVGSKPVEPPVLREYIARARQHQPVVPPEVAPYIVEAYVSLRSQDRPGARHGKTNDQTVMTARQLLSILRLSQALARLRFADFVSREDVDEAIRLTDMSKASLKDDNNSSSGRKRGRGEDVMSKIFNIIRDFATTSRTKQLELRLCEAMVLRKGFTSQQLESCLEEYEKLDVIQVNRTRTQVYFTNS